MSWLLGHAKAIPLLTISVRFVQAEVRHLPLCPYTSWPGLHTAAAAAGMQKELPFPSHTLPDVRLCSQDVTSYTGGGCGRQKSQRVLTRLHKSSRAGGTNQQSERMEL